MKRSFQTRYARQWILPGVGASGQQTWSDSVFLLSGSGTAAESCREALVRAGAGHVHAWDGSEASHDAFHLVLSSDPATRLQASRAARRSRRPALFGWTLPGGYALALFPHRKKCPCYECFLSSNPKSIARNEYAWEGPLGAHAASEALLAILSASPIENQAWLTYGGTGQSLKHAVRATSLCAACDADPGGKP